MDDGDRQAQDLAAWDLGAGGRGFLLLPPTGDLPELRLWELNAYGQPTHAEVQERLDLEPDRVLASLIIEPDGQTLRCQLDATRRPLQPAAS